MSNSSSDHELKELLQFSWTLLYFYLLLEISITEFNLNNRSIYK